ncbi:winged helix-turn-helix domain-containing protein [Candidatus Micrarchaeota archaeon]|nr:winged helix-turn-helix domain-containing protein [Candidatus Micrarchaeota archaeon]
MKRIECAWAWLLQDALNGRSTGTQAELARRSPASLSTVNAALKPLERVGAIQIRPRGFHVQDAKKILWYWCSHRNLEKDVAYSTRAGAMNPRDIEKNMPAGTLFTGYTGFKLHFGQVPADYSEVYAYVEDANEVRKRFPPAQGPKNLFVMEKPSGIPAAKNAVSLPHLYADVWNLPHWYAKDFLNALEGKLHGILA